MESSEAWIKRKCFLKTLEEIDEIRNFSLLWNYFEAEVCGKNGRYEEVTQYVKRFPAMGFDKEQKRILETVFEYFRRRYAFDSQGENELFQTLGLKNCLLRDLKSELNIPDASVEEKLVPLLKICFRFRNNFFHGTKEIGDLKKYNQPFENLNKVLMILNNLAS